MNAARNALITDIKLSTGASDEEIEEMFPSLVKGTLDNTDAYHLGVYHSLISRLLSDDQTPLEWVKDKGLTGAPRFEMMKEGKWEELATEGMELLQQDE